MKVSGFMRRAAVEVTDEELRAIRPLPFWFFAFEGLMGAAFDIVKLWDGAWMLLAGLAAVNAVVGLTVLRRRVKLVKAMLRKGRTRKIMLGLIGLRVGVHVVLGAVGAEAGSAAAHLALAVGMTAVTMALLWFDQRVTFRALGLAPEPVAEPVAEDAAVRVPVAA
ncbi:hypothetical protein [Actinomadura parmotrematis]|uniref:DUF1622 domain-containing protein n=1 Tax=Actinomadura parmotrematis TaxID=2864039 RepID=A0ABS7FRR5_9ACTN|nr:hypothetical protein [Actinomadura parmotrematis]MBW8483095.1 hypothetical protein [Actinomadura parmotrematis]